MYVNAEQDSESFLVLDADTGERINGVVEADTDEGWLRIIPYGQVFSRPNGFRLVRLSDKEEVGRTAPGAVVEVRVSFDLNGENDVWTDAFRVVDAETGEVIPYLTAADTHTGTFTVLLMSKNERGGFTPETDEDGEPVMRTVRDRPFHVVALKPESMRGHVLAESVHWQGAAA